MNRPPICAELDRIRALAECGHCAEAIRDVLALLPAEWSRHRDEAVSHRTRWESVEEEERQGFMGAEEASRNHLRIQRAILQFLRVLDAECTQLLSPPAQTPPPPRLVDAPVAAAPFPEQRPLTFAQALARLKEIAHAEKLSSRNCFISYAWGDPAHERWVRERLAVDLKAAGIQVVLDVWENAGTGSNILRFLEKLESCQQVVVICTPLLRTKITQLGRGVVAGEWDIIGMRILLSRDHTTVLPVLLAGEAADSIPALLRARVYADFRDPGAYQAMLFDLALDIYALPRSHPPVAALRTHLRPLPPGT